MSTFLSARTILLFLAVALLNIFFFRSWDGLGTAVLIGAFYLLITLTHLQDLRSQATKKWFLMTSLGIALSAIVVVVRANDFVQTVAVLTAQLLLIALWNSLQATQPGVHSFAELVMTPFTALRNHVVGLARFMLKSTSVAKPARSPLSGQKLKSLIIGVLISIPILAAVTALLSAGDPIFQATLNDIFDIQLNIDEKIIQRIVLTMLFTVLLIPFVQRKLGVPFTSPLRGLSKFSLTTEFSVVVSLLTLLLGFFLAIQWKYIFVSVAAETDLSQFGVATYSEYVTRGFAELQFVSVIIYSVVWLGLVLVRVNNTLASAKRLKLLQLVLLAEFGIFLLSLFRRIWLYQSLHGMTVVRGYGAYFILLVTLFAVTLAGRHLTTRSIRWVQVELAILICSVFLLSTFNIENYLATSHPPTVNDRVDYVYLSRLSPDGVAGWQKSLAHAESVLNNPDLAQAEIISTDQRREIAYAGAIVKVLQLHRYHILQKYGNSGEIKEFYSSSLTAADQRYSERLAEYLEIGGSQSATASSLLAQREKVRAVQNDVNNLVGTHPKFLNYDVHSIFYPGRSNCSALYCFLTFFNWDEYKVEAERADGVQQILNYNTASWNAYMELETLLPMDKLLELEDKYFEFQKKINTQPENEKNFEVDIDFYSPFISDL